MHNLTICICKTTSHNTFSKIVVMCIFITALRGLSSALYTIVVRLCSYMHLYAQRRNTTTLPAFLLKLNTYTMRKRWWWVPGSRKLYATYTRNQCRRAQNPGPAGGRNFWKKFLNFAKEIFIYTTCLQQFSTQTTLFAMSYYVNISYPNGDKFWCKR